MEKTIKYIKLAELIAKEVTETLSDNERRKLDELLNDKAVRSIYTKAKSTLQSEQYSKSEKEINVDEVRVKLENRLSPLKKVESKKNNIVNFIKYAAIISIPLGVMLWVLFSSLPNDQSIADDAINPGSTKATLYLSDGATVDLIDPKNEQIKEGDFLISNDSAKGLNYQYHHEHLEMTEVLENRLVTPRGGEYNIILSDGTKVWLNAVSEIRYPVKFIGKTRKVKIKGEVYFEVAHNKKQPFVVEADNIEVEVLGTHFNIMAYENEKNIETTLVQGAIRVTGSGSNGKAKSYKLSPGKQAVYSRFDNSISVKEVDPDIYTAWIKGKFLWSNQNLEFIMNQLERWYDVDVVYDSEELMKYRFNARLQRYGNIDDILRKLEMTTDIVFETNNQTITVKRQ